MADITYSQTDDPFFRAGRKTLEPVQATDEQNQRVRMILDALKAGMAPSAAGVPGAEGLTPVTPTNQPIQPGQQSPFLLRGYGGPGGSPVGTQPPAPMDRFQQFQRALQTNPQQAMQVLQGMGQQMEGVPKAAQQSVLQGLGLVESPEAIEARKQAMAVKTEALKKQIDAEVKGNAPLAEKAKLYYNEFGEPAKPTMSFTEAEKQGYTPRDATQIRQIPAAKSVYLATEKLRPLVDKLLVKVQNQEKKLPWYVQKFGSFVGIQQNRAAMQMLRATGDPDVRQFDQFVQAGLARYLMALGIPGGRETVAMMQRMSVEFPDTFDSAEAAKQVLSNVDEMLYTTTGVKRKPGGKGGAAPRVKMGGTYYLNMGGNNWYVDPNQGE